MISRVLDRLPAPATVSAAYPMRALVSPRRDRSYTWRHVQFDQGNQGACTVFAAMTEAAARPKPFYGDPLDRVPWAMPGKLGRLNDWARGPGYLWVRQHDYWPGEDYVGSSLDAACKLGRAVGWWDGWRWALGSSADKVRDVVTTIGYHGPVMLASTWREAMWSANGRGYLRYQGADHGGHAYLLSAVSLSRQAVWTPNSWGGQGQGWITFTDLEAMFSEDAEAAAPVGRHFGLGALP